MDSEKKPSQELAGTPVIYETENNPEFNDSAAMAQTLEQKSAGGPATSANPVINNSVLPAQSVAAPPVDPLEPVVKASSSTVVPPDESSEEDFSAFIEKARQIVDRTKGNPHAQNREINQLKIQFMKQQFNKDINPTGPV